MKIAVLTAAGIGVAVVASQAHANTVHESFIDVSQSVSFDGWQQLNRAGLGGGDQTTATNAIVAGVTGNVAGSGDAVLKRLSGGIYPAGAGMYGAGVLEVSDASIAPDITSIEFQGIINDFDADAVLTLSYNGGAQALSPALVTFGDTGTLADYYHYSWDLTALGETINSYSIELSAGFVQVLALQVDQVAVPEPTAFAAIAGALGLMMRRRRSI